MGTYDELYYEVDLPDRDVPADTRFQSKSFPRPNFSRYRITATESL
jgi:hypothetical protein